MTPSSQNQEKKSIFTSTELRIIAISLSILSLGLAIAWMGLMFFLGNEKNFLVQK